jgi:hypothetical protein
MIVDTCDVLTVVPTEIKITAASNCPLPEPTTDITIPTDYKHKDVLYVTLEARNVARIR